MEKLEIKGLSFDSPIQMLKFKEGENKRQALKDFITFQAKLAYKNKGDF